MLTCGRNLEELETCGDVWKSKGYEGLFFTYVI